MPERMIEGNGVTLWTGSSDAASLKLLSDVVETVIAISRQA